MSKDRGSRAPVLVAVDRSASALAALDAAAEAAARLGADLLALFVEDVDLVKLAELPFAREFGMHCEPRPFGREELERRFRVDVREARSACEQAALRRRVNLRFQVVRGAVAGEILAASEGAQMVVLGRSREGGRMLGRTARRVLAQVVARGERTVALVPGKGGAGRAVAVLHDGSHASARALALALRLAAQDHGNLVVLLVGDEAARARARRESLEAAAAVGIAPRFVVLRGDGVEVRRALREHCCPALVLDRDLGWPAAEGLEAMVREQDCAVYVTG